MELHFTGLTQSKPRRTWCARAARQRPLVSRVQDKIKSCPGTYWRAAEPSGSSASGNGSGTGGRSRGFGLPPGICARPRRRRPLRQGSLPAPFPLFQYVPLQLSYLSRHLALVNLVGIQSFSFYYFVIPQAKIVLLPPRTGLLRSARQRRRLAARSSTSESSTDDSQSPKQEKVIHAPAPHHTQSAPKN